MGNRVENRLGSEASVCPGAERSISEMGQRTGRRGDVEESGAEMTRQRVRTSSGGVRALPLDRVQRSPKVTRPFKFPCPWEAGSPFLKPQTHELHFGSGKSSVQHRMGHKGRHFITAIVISVRSDRSLMSTARCLLPSCQQLSWHIVQPGFLDGNTEVGQDGARSQLSAPQVTPSPSPPILRLAAQLRGHPCN